jgi:uncharacterized low-complexity protein
MMAARIAATDEHSVSTVTSHVGQRHGLVVEQKVRVLNPRPITNAIRFTPAGLRSASKKGRSPFELPAAIAPAISVASTHVAIATNAVATVSVNRPCADTTVRAANQSNALNVRSWGKWGERDCGRGSCRSKAAERSKSNKCGFEFHSFPPVEDVEH